ncbi:MAG: PDZ domain-containing protein, partial [Cyclobacteriaceae bacterium]
DGTYAGINARQAMLNIPAAFIYIPALKQSPITVNFHLPLQWQVATQMPRQEGSYFAPNLDYFMDSPTLLAEMDIFKWQEKDQNKTIDFRLAIHHQGDSAYLNDYVNWIKKIVREQKKVFGEYPDFDYDAYTFIANYAPYARGDGMEHRNSTILSSSGSIFLAGSRLIGTVSHEFMHAWNVERLRPASLQPFLYDRANMTSALWFAEGFTSYYTDLILCRAGIISQEQYIEEVQRMINVVITSPGHNYRGPAEMSQMAPFVDAAAHSDATCFYNTYISYYTYGSVIGLALDLNLRQQYETSLDEFMKLLWQNFGKNEIPYTLNDLQNILAHLTDQEFAGNFFRQYIFGHDLPDFESLLNEMGINTKPAFGNQLFLADFRPIVNQYGILIDRYPEKNSPLYRAGVDKGDRITHINQEKITGNEQIEQILRQTDTGDVLPITYEQLGAVKTGFIKPMQRKHLTLTLEPNTVDQEALLNSWLSNN